MYPDDPKMPTNIRHVLCQIQTHQQKSLKAQGKDKTSHGGGNESSNETPSLMQTTKNRERKSKGNKGNY